MNKIIDWIKSNLGIVICSLVAAIAIVFIVLGMMDDRVHRALQTDAPLASNLTGLRPINENVLVAALAEQEGQRRQLLEELNRGQISKKYEPLIGTVFPEMTEDDKFTAPYAFRKAFREKQASFIRILNARDRVSATGRTRGLAPWGRPRDTEREDFASPRFDPRSERGRPPLGPVEDFERDSIVPSRERPQISRDDLIHAQGMYLYGNIDNLDSQNPAVREVNERTGLLTLEQMWMAQISLWIQEDIVEVLRSLNEQAAQGLDEGKRWVAYLPVKHLKEFRTARTDGFYQTSASAGAAGARGSGLDQDVFVGPRPPNVDAIRFNLNLVVEANALLPIIERISDSGFYTLLEPTRISAIQPETASPGYIYGSAPAVEIDMLWEACFLREDYEHIMPEEIKKMLASESPGMSVPSPRGERFSPRGIR